MRILLAVDGSQCSDRALKAVIARTQPKDAEIRVVHVVEPPSLLVAREMGGTTALDKAWEAETKQTQALVTKVADSCALRAERTTRWNRRAKIQNHRGGFEVACRLDRCRIAWSQGLGTLSDGKRFGSCGAPRRMFCQDRSNSVEAEGRRPCPLRIMQLGKRSYI